MSGDVGGAGAERDGSTTDDRRYFDEFGGRYVPEALVPALEELADAHQRYVRAGAEGFREELDAALADFAGRPTPLQYAPGLSERYGRDVYLKREDLVHGGAHKLNNALGQVLLATYMGKDRIIAETGAGQHGTATAMAAAHVGLDCEVYMGRTDMNRQRPNVFRMRAAGATVTPVEAGSGTLKEAINETLRDWAGSVESTHYVLGSVVGPAPFPRLVRDLQAVIGAEAREQIREHTGALPDTVLACAGGGSNTMGTFHPFVDDTEVDLVAVEAAGEGLTGDGVDRDPTVAPHSASLSVGTPGVCHGARTRLLQDDDGQIKESRSVSAGLDYAGVGPELAALAERGRVQTATADDEAALQAFHRLARLEGILPALESSHALAYLEATCGPDADGSRDLGEVVVVTLSGRGDKDLETVLEETAKRDLPEAADLEGFE